MNKDGHLRVWTRPVGIGSGLVHESVSILIGIGLDLDPIGTLSV